jgi:predicted AAA+ superfamily ATPase
MTEFIDRFLMIDSFLIPGRALILYGPPRVGKTTLLISQRMGKSDSQRISDQ